MDRDGNTLAASNWDLPLTFVGKNFGFRPYFREALAGRAGRFYGIGITTSEPGYFIAQPVRDGATRVAGVVAVKISLDEFERNWSGSEDTIVLADRAGVVFLSNRPDWKYRSLRRLSCAAAARHGRHPPVRAPADHAAGRRTGARTPARPVGRLGWQLQLFPSGQRVARNAALWALGAALLLASGAIAGWALHQRRRRLEERRASRRLQHAARNWTTNWPSARTAATRPTRPRNQVRHAEGDRALLRSTQNELVQAGKLAMLGQMAAGVTHELNQPLAAIRAFADNARTYLERGQADKAGENLGHIGDASARMGAIIGQLKGFARRSDTVATVDLARSMHASAFLLQGEFKRLGVVLAYRRRRRDALLVAGDAVRIEQVFINLLRNRARRGRRRRRRASSR